MAVEDIYELKGHRSSALHGVEITTGRAEAAVTAERDKFQLAAVGTAVHGAAERLNCYLNCQIFRQKLLTFLENSLLYYYNIITLIC